MGGFLVAWFLELALGFLVVVAAGILVAVQTEAARLTSLPFGRVTCE